MHVLHVDRVVTEQIATSMVDRSVPCFPKLILLQTDSKRNTRSCLSALLYYVCGVRMSANVNINMEFGANGSL
jgi:hypothetical protein